MWDDFAICFAQRTPTCICARAQTKNAHSAYLHCTFVHSVTVYAHLDRTLVFAFFFRNGNKSRCEVPTSDTFRYKSIPRVVTSNLRSINEVCLVVSSVADFRVLHQLSATLHQPEPPGPAVQRPAALPL